MADFRGRPLEYDELAFLIGSLFVDGISARMGGRPSRIPFGRLLRLIRLARGSSAITGSQIAVVSGLSGEEIEDDFVRKFDTSLKEESRRHAVGSALLSARTAAGGLVEANLLLLKGRLHGAGIPASRLRRRRSAGAGKAKSYDNANRHRQEGHPRLSRAKSRILPPAVLEPWETEPDGFNWPDRIATEPGLEDLRKPPFLGDDEPDLPPPWDEAANAASSFHPEGVVNGEGFDGPGVHSRLYRGESDELPPVTLEPWESVPDGLAWLDQIPTEPGLEELKAPEFLIDDELAEEPLSSAELKLATAIESDPAKRRAMEWLRELGHDNTGVRIEPYAATLVENLDQGVLKAINTHARLGHHLQALQLLEGATAGMDARSGAGLYLQRLIAVLRCVESGYRLPEPRAAPEYECAPDTVFYLAHMRDPYEANGYVSRTHLILTSLAASGVKPIAITRLGFPSDLARHRREQIAEFEVLDDIPTLSLRDPRDGQLGRPIDNYIDAYADRVVELARRYRPAAIHAASNFMNGLAAIRAARILGIPAIYEVRGIWEITQASAEPAYENTIRYSLQRKLENAAVSAADRVIAISEPLRRFVVEHGAQADRVSVVPNGVDASRMRSIKRDRSVMKRLGLGPHDVVIGYVGSVVHYEGLDYIIQALKLLKEQGVTGFRFVVVGGGRELGSLKALAERLQVADLCIFAGRVARSEVEAFYSVIDIVPLPRRSLPVTELVPPLKPFEAMAAGKAVIVSSVEAIADTVIDGKTGVIVEKDDVPQLAEALRKLIGNPSLRRDMGARSQEWVRRERSVDSLARQLRAVYDSLDVEPVISDG